MSDRSEASRVCPKCNTGFTPKNFARHFQRCLGLNGQTCEGCGVSGFTNLKNHRKKGPCARSSQPAAAGVEGSSEQRPISEVVRGFPAVSKFVHDVLQKLYDHETQFNTDLIQWVRAKTWYHIDEIPAHIRNAWPTILPRLFPAGDCWKHQSNTLGNRLPTDLEAWKAALDDIIQRRPNQPGSYYVHDMRDGTSSDIHLVMAQLRVQEDEIEDLQRNPLIAVNLPLRTLDYTFQIPPALQRDIFINDDSISFSANGAPRYALVDLHIDRGMEAISSCIGRCRKIWFLWPPLEKNLTEMRQLDYQRNQRLIRSTLDEGLIFETDSSTALHIPAGWLHATFTIEGGFLGGVTAVAGESIGILSSWILVEISARSDDLQGNLKIYIDALEVALRSSKNTVILDAIAGWRSLEPRLQELSRGTSRDGTIAANQCESLIHIWEEFLGMADTSLLCCDNPPDSPFPAHFEQRHLAFLRVAVTTRDTVRKRKRNG